jgi:hypothetical protein
VAETGLRFEERTRRLFAMAGTRKEVRRDFLFDAVLSVIGANPGIGLDKLRRAVRQIAEKAGTDAIADAIGRAEDNNLVRVDRLGVGKPTTHWLVPQSDFTDTSPE